MTGRDDDAPSFDPKSWSADSAADGAPSRDPTSFDPRAWAGDAVEPPATEAPPERDTTSFDPRAWQSEDGVPPAPPSADPPKRGRMMLIGGVAALLVAGGAGAMMMRSGAEAPAPAPTPTASIAAPAVSAAADPDRRVGRRTLAIAGPADILPTLIAAEIAKDDSAAAAKAAQAALGAGTGEVRLEFDIVTSKGATRLTRLVATRDDGSGLTLMAKADGGFASERMEAKLEARVKVVRGEMDANSFYSAAVAAGVEDSLIDGFANAFSFDFNFATDIAEGDIFEAAFEYKVNPSGQSVGKSRLLYVSITTKDKSRALYQFLAPGETEPGWFDANGRSTVRALMRTPVDGARITSNFGMRFHPVLHYNRLHGGTDFAAPVGTPVYAAAGGTVVSASPSSCAGNMVIVRHDNGWETRYFHLSRYADGIVAGARVEQRMTVGDVGNTGKCTTGPHLHYEVHIAGEKVDPMSIDTGTGTVLDGPALEAFRKERDRIDKLRADQAS